MDLVVNEPQHNVHENNEDHNYLIGVILAVSSSLFIGGSYILKKLSLLKLSKSNSSRASAGGFGYLKDWIWWTGFLSMGIGEFLNLIAYGFAPASLVTPLGALSVLISTVLATKYLQESLTSSGGLRTMCCWLSYHHTQCSKRS
ncbi:magnesium transporter NIPA2 [Coccinella septempunctata]|uniref:magnesium transporter NIPA2 n=1 Tax=Coccinella septempunctata TaxID=41139 RepID=UPI001D075981|nr:magnesium transporter NIPA2 [Coccinella septempunctata]